jgi:hypothetical protein
MKRIRLLVVLGALAVALPLGLTAAKAAGTTSGSSGSVSIVSPAQYNFEGTYITVQLYVSCPPAGAIGTGVVNLTVDQEYPETPVLAGAHGTFIADVVCDGRSRAVGVTVPVGPYDAGKAFATAVLVPPSGSTVEASRWIQIAARA